MIFVDTGAWFASVVPSDADHASALHWLGQNAEQLLTTDYIVDETLTLLRARGESTRAIRLGEQLFSGALAKVYFLTEAGLERATGRRRGDAALRSIPNAG